MTLLDANILLLAYNQEAPGHTPARVWLEELFAGSGFVGLPWVTLWAFVRISTNRRLFPRPLPPEEAFAIVRSWLTLPRVVVVVPGPRHLEILASLVIECQAAGSLMSDAALAALAIEHGAAVASTDHDFRRFPSVRWINPLSSVVSRN